MAICNFKILDFNWLAHDNVGLTATSEDVNFPATNMAHDFRSKVWRSSGYFEVTDSNKHVDFREVNAGPEITAILATGDYTPASLATEIKNKLDLYSDNARTYTVSYSTISNKWTITGETFLELLTLTGTNIATSIYNDVGYDVSLDYIGAISYVGSRNAIHTSESLVIDLKTTENVGAVALLWDPRIGSNLSSDAVVKFQGNATLNWTSPAIDETLTIDDVREIATNSVTNGDYRYWRIEITDPQNNDGYVELGTVYLSPETLFKCPDHGFKYKLRDQSRIRRNNYGNTYVDQYPLKQRLEFEFKNSDYTDYMTVLEDVYRQVGQAKPICVWFDSEANLFEANQFFIYGRITTQLDVEHSFYTSFNLGFNIEEVF